MKKVTMQQIADQLGVSKFAVSQALSGKPGVSDETRNKIMQAAAALGYYNQRHTRHKTRPAAADTDKKQAAFKSTVIVLMPNVRSQLPESMYWGRIVDGVIGALTDWGIGSMVVTEHNSDRFLHIINPENVLGLIGIGFVSGHVVLEIRKAGLPFVLIDHEDALVLSDTIFMNNCDCMRKMTEQLIYLGHTRLRFVGNPSYSRSFADRWLGFRLALEDAGLPAPDAKDRLLALDENLEAEIRDIIRTMEANKTLPTAFVCANDYIGGCVVRGLQAAGVAVPAEVSVSGFDNTDEATRVTPQLSTIDVPKAVLGKRAVEMLMKKIEDPGKPYEKTLIHGDFINRQSIAPAPEPASSASEE